MRTLVYRFREHATWGIWIRLRAEVIISEVEPVRGSHAIGPFWVDLGTVKLAGEALEYLLKGIALVEADISPLVQDRKVLVSFDAIDFSLTDFQEEGLAVAMANWLAEEFGTIPPRVVVAFDPESNRYVFSWQSQGGPEGA